MMKFLLNEKLLLALVVLNMAAIFLQLCGVHSALLDVFDMVCTLIFLAEMAAKHAKLGVRGYWRDGWNALDGVVTLLSLPALLAYFLPAVAGMKIVVAFRAVRVFKLFRAARRFPNIAQIWKGFKLALRQSAGFLLAYFVIIVVIAMFNCAMFSALAPQYFATPLDAIYAVFQLFTVEGWYEIPNAVAGEMSPVWTHVVRVYFCLLLIGGGIIGMSLINSIFVDALAADNNDDVKAQLNAMERRMQENQQRLEERIEELSKMLKDRK